MPDELCPIQDYQYLFTHFTRVLSTRGPLSFIDYIKGVRTALLLHLSGEFPDKRVNGIRVTNDGIPLVLGPLINKIRRGYPPALLRVINTILFMTRALNLGRSPDILSITGPTKSGLPEIDEFTRSFWFVLGYRAIGHIPRSLHFKKFHFTSKSGPNGHALWTCLGDLFCLDSLTIS